MGMKMRDGGFMTKKLNQLNALEGSLHLAQLRLHCAETELEFTSIKGTINRINRELTTYYNPFGYFENLDSENPCAELIFPRRGAQFFIEKSC